MTFLIVDDTEIMRRLIINALSSYSNINFEQANHGQEALEMLRSIKKIKEDEDRELKQWEAEIQAIKGEFEKINQNLFSML